MYIIGCEVNVFLIEIFIQVIWQIIGVQPHFLNPYVEKIYRKYIK